MSADPSHLSPAAVRLSVVVPLYNERENVRPLYEQLRDVLPQLGLPYELVLVDDGSDDGTRDALVALQSCDPTVRVICLRRNFGQTAAMQAGIRHARGEYLVTLDGDLQNDPRDIPRLLAKLDEGFDLVIGWRRERKDSLLFRRLPSWIANRIIAAVTGVRVHDTGCSLKACRAEMIRRIPLYSDLHRFIPTLSTLVTGRLAEVVVRHHPRQRGRSKYGLSRVGRVLLDVLAVKMLVSSARRPLHWFGRWAILLLALAGMTGLVAGRWALAGKADAGFSLGVISLLLAYLASHLIFTGVLGELVVHSGSSLPGDPLLRWTNVGARNGG